MSGHGNFTAGLLALIGGQEDPAQPRDDAFVTEMTDVLGSPPHVIVSNTPMASIAAAHRLPAIVVEQGDGESRPISEGSDSAMLIGGSAQQFSSTLNIAVVWRDQDRASAFLQRTLLPEIFARLMLRNPMPGGIAGAWLESWNSDRGVNHPLHVWGAEIRGEYEIQRD